MSTDPPFYPFSSKGWQSTGLELRIPMIYKISWNWPRKLLETPRKKTITLPGDPSPPLYPIRPIYEPINSSQRQEFIYLII